MIDTGAAASLPAILKAARSMPEPTLPQAPSAMDAPQADPAGAQ